MSQWLKRWYLACKEGLIGQPVACCVWVSRAFVCQFPGLEWWDSGLQGAIISGQRQFEIIWISRSLKVEDGYVPISTQSLFEDKMLGRSQNTVRLSPDDCFPGAKFHPYPKWPVHHRRIKQDKFHLNFRNYSNMGWCLGEVVMLPKLERVDENNPTRRAWRMLLGNSGSKDSRDKPDPRFSTNQSQPPRGWFKKWVRKLGSRSHQLEVDAVFLIRSFFKCHHVPSELPLASTVFSKHKRRSFPLPACRHHFVTAATEIAGRHVAAICRTVTPHLTSIAPD